VEIKVSQNSKDWKIIRFLWKNDSEIFKKGAKLEK
jgi:hypothetical protein